MANLFEYLNNAIMNHPDILARTRKDDPNIVEDAEKWRQFLKQFEGSEFFGDSTNRHYK